MVVRCWRSSCRSPLSSLPSACSPGSYGLHCQTFCHCSCCVYCITHLLDLSCLMLLYYFNLKYHVGLAPEGRTRWRSSHTADALPTSLGSVAKPAKGRRRCRMAQELMVTCSIISHKGCRKQSGRESLQASMLTGQTSWSLTLCPSAGVHSWPNPLPCPD